jgi:hypothetical protein
MFQYASIFSKGAKDFAKIPRAKGKKRTIHIQGGVTTEKRESERRILLADVAEKKGR